MPGILYVVATPIGNLEDVTLRALRVLREVPLIAAEDTRRTSRLLQHYSISTRTTSLHEHNERTRTPSLVARLLAGDSIALVSDAGTPGISDPGAHLVSAAREAGIRVEPIPGPNAAIAALSASGVGGPEFLFVGFPPPRSQARRKWIGRLALESRPLVLYEAPHRIQACLADLALILGNRTICIARELTKTHEELVICTINEAISRIDAGRGEYTLVVYSAPAEESPKTDHDERSIANEFGQLTTVGGLSRRAALRELAGKYSIPAREVFSLLERAKTSGE